MEYDAKAIKSLGLNDSDLSLVPASDREQMVQMRPSTTYWQDAFRRIKKNKMAMTAFFILMIIMLSCIIIPQVSPYTYDQQDRNASRLGPCYEHPLGTDKLGRDTLVRLMVGTRISFLIGFVTMAIVLVVGTLYGGFSAYIGGWVDNILMRIVDLLMAIPSMLIIILLSVSIKENLKQYFVVGGILTQFSRLGSGLLSIFIVLALFNWLGMARAVRGAILMNRNQEYILAAEALGARPLRIIRRHLLPNAMSVVLLSATSIVPGAIFTESFLSFIGLGVTAPMASLGSMANEALNGIQSDPMNMVYPALIISLIILGFNILGDGLRDALDPRLRK